MTENEAIKVIRNHFPKTSKMVDGRYVGGFDDTECDFGKALLLSISALEEIHQYRALGTVEELKEAMEKQNAKKPDKKYRKFPTVCRVCGSEYIEEFNANTGEPLFHYNYCAECGSAIDWSEEE